MKKGYVTIGYVALIAMLLFSRPALGQNYATSVGATGGYAEDGFGVNVSLNYHMNRWSYIQIGVFGAYAKEEYLDIRIPYSVFSFQPGYYRRIILIDASRPIAVYLGGGPIAGYEILNNGSTDLSNGAILDARSKFIYGGFLSLEVEFPLSEKFSLALKASEHGHINSDIGKLYPFVGAGFRYYLN